MTHRRQRRSPAGIGLLCAGLLAAGLYGADRLAASRGADAAVPPPSGAPAAPGEASEAGEAGEAAAPARYVRPVAGAYSLALTSRVTSGGESALLDFELVGRLALAPVGAERDGLWQLTFDGRFAAFGGRATALDSAQTMQDALGQPWRLQLGEDGRVRDVRVVAGLSPVVAQIWKSVAFSLQFVPAAAPAWSWQTEERDAIGRCVAEYRVTRSDARGIAVRKTKREYLDTEGGRSPLQAEYHIERAELDVRFDEHARWSGLEHTETLRVDALGGLPGFTSTSRLALVRAALEPPPPALAGTAAAGEPELESAFAATSRPVLLGSARLSGLSWGDALARLHEAATQPDPDEAQQKRAGRAYLALTEHLRRDPGRVAIAERAVREGGLLVQTWIEALRDADTEHSQAALARLTRADALPPAQRLLVVRALGHVATPSPTTLAALEALAADPRVGRQALYGVGSNIYRLRAPRPELAGAAAARLAAELERSEDPAEQARLLVALGNAGHPRALALARARLAHPAERVRAAALQAVRRVDDVAADRLLVTGLADPNPSVRRSALDALRDRQPEDASVRALGALLRDEPSPGVRGQALNLALRWLPRATGLASAVAQVAEQDQNPSLRAAARRALAAR